MELQSDWEIGVIETVFFPKQFLSNTHKQPIHTHNQNMSNAWKKLKEMVGVEDEDAPTSRLEQFDQPVTANRRTVCFIRTISHRVFTHFSFQHRESLDLQ